MSEPEGEFVPAYRIYREWVHRKDRTGKSVLAVIRDAYAAGRRDQSPLAELIATLPATDEQYLAWMRKHQLGHGAGVGTVISCIRNDLRRLIERKPGA